MARRLQSRLLTTLFRQRSALNLLRQDRGPCWHARFIMTRAVLSAAIDSDWKQVSNDKPCPVCGAKDACSVHTADAFACCAREPSEWKLTNGSWLHRLPQTRAASALPANSTELVANVNAIRP